MLKFLIHMFCPIMCAFGLACFLAAAGHGLVLPALFGLVLCAGNLFLMY